jgi:uncharacterized protein YjlB
MTATRPEPDPQIIARRLEQTGGIPNHPDLPLLLVRQAVSALDADQIERTIQDNNWTGTWRNGIYDYHHFHPDAHEVLALAAGWAKVQFGGPGGPMVDLDAGDVAVLPAGTGHKRIDASRDLLVIGGYPAGQSRFQTLEEDLSSITEARRQIRATEIPGSDPIYGADGPLVRRWRRD